MRFLTALLLILCSLGATRASDDSGAVTLTPGFKLHTIFENDETCGKYGVFRIKRARATLDGERDRLAAHVTVETIDDDDGVILLQGYATYSFHRAFRLQAGQMYVPFGLENRRGFDRRKFYNRALVTDGLAREMGRRPEGERSARFRDIGVMAFGAARFESGYEINYMAMIFNGNGILTVDNNDFKDIAGRAQFVGPIGFALGASAYYGRFFDAADTVDRDETAFGIDLQWNGRLGGRECQVQAEYAAATWDDPDGNVRPAGFYLYAAIEVFSELEAGLRYDRYEPDRNAPVDEVNERVSLTARYALGHGSLLAADYEFRGYDGDRVGNLLAIHLLAVF